jgi:hypothetical protein
MGDKKADVISDALLSVLNKKFSEASKSVSEDGVFSELGLYRKKRRIMSEEEILDFWKRNVVRSKVISVSALVLPVFAAFMLFQGLLKPITVCWIGLGGMTIFAFCQLFLIEGLERLLGTWKATSFKQIRKTGENRWKYVDAAEDFRPLK